MKPGHLLGALVAATLIVATGCKKSSSTGILQAADTTVPDGETFDPNEIIASKAFKDSSTLAEGDLQQFLHATPYGHSSFLETYQSDGTSAADAVLNAAQTYRINPIVFFVEAEVAQGLVGAGQYPTDASRVEYVFGCGCYGPGDCDPSFAGFDKQVNCLGQQLRTSLDAMSANGKTVSGWGPMIQKDSADGVAVNPNDDSTAALYNWNPYVGEGSSGEWLTWNIWTLYAGNLGYGTNETTASSGWVGDGCFTAEGCNFASAVCARGGYPDGMCTRQCSSDADCPNDAEHTSTFCGDFGASGGYCIVSCMQAATSECRDGYTCRSVKKEGSTSDADACIPPS